MRLIHPNRISNQANEIAALLDEKLKGRFVLYFTKDQPKKGLHCFLMMPMQNGSYKKVAPNQKIPGLNIKVLDNGNGLLLVTKSAKKDTEQGTESRNELDIKA